MNKQKKVFEQVRIQVSVAILNVVKYRCMCKGEKYNVNQIDPILYNSIGDVYTTLIKDVQEKGDKFGLSLENELMMNYITIILRAIDVEETDETKTAVFELIKKFFSAFMRIMMKQMIKNMQRKQVMNLDNKIEDMQNDGTVTSEPAEVVTAEVVSE